MLRPLLAAAALASLAASPAAARSEDRDARTDQVGRAARQLHDPINQAAVASAVRVFSDSLLDLDVTPLARAIDAAHGGDPRAAEPDMRLRDLAGPEADRMPAEMSRRLPRMMDAMGDMAGAFAVELPRLEAMGRAMRERLEDAGER